MSGEFMRLRAAALAPTEMVTIRRADLVFAIQHHFVLERALSMAEPWLFNEDGCECADMDTHEWVREALGQQRQANYALRDSEFPASGIETEGHDPKGHGAQHESPTAESGDAHG
jgi:hypothetical protein